MQERACCKTKDFLLRRLLGNGGLSFLKHSQITNSFQSLENLQEFKLHSSSCLKKYIAHYIQRCFIKSYLVLFHVFMLFLLILLSVIFQSSWLNGCVFYFSLMGSLWFLIKKWNSLAKSVLRIVSWDFIDFFGYVIVGLSVGVFFFFWIYEHI